MAISIFDKDVNIIAKLGDNPNIDNSLSADDLKGKFDAAAALIQNYINNTLVPAINANIANIASQGTTLAGKADAATTLAGYGITDAMTAAAITAALALKQDLIHVVTEPPEDGDDDGIYLVKAAAEPEE